MFDQRGIQLGYLSAERAPWIGGMIANGREIAAIFQEQTKYGAVIRVAFDGAVPELPPERVEERRDDSEFVDPEPDWAPDEDWPT